MSNNSITVTIKSSFGTERIYPVCDDAVRFALLTNTKTLSRQDIKIIKGLGYTVHVEQTSPATL